MFLISLVRVFYALRPFDSRLYEVNLQIPRTLNKLVFVAGPATFLIPIACTSKASNSDEMEKKQSSQTEHGFLCGLSIF